MLRKKNDVKHMLERRRRLYFHNYSSFFSFPHDCSNYCCWSTHELSLFLFLHVGFFSSAEKYYPLKSAQNLNCCGISSWNILFITARQQLTDYPCINQHTANISLRYGGKAERRYSRELVASCGRSGTYIHTTIYIYMSPVSASRDWLAVRGFIIKAWLPNSGVTFNKKIALAKKTVIFSTSGCRFMWCFF